MRLEHVAYLVADPEAAAAWYCQHLGFSIKRALSGPTRCQFLADSSDQVMLEIYRRDDMPLPDYANQDPLVLHLAFTVTGDLPAERARLIAAGAVPDSGPETTPAGDTLAMLRDPWGLAIQLVQRADPMV